MRLAAAANALVPAILLLEGRGYTVSVDRDGGTERWVARRGDTEVQADDPLAALGLACIAEARGEAWRATDEQIDATMLRFALAGRRPSLR